MAVSKEPEKFGKGAMEGVIAPGACNNSKEGGQLIPTVGFGIPGSAAMAIMLGAFLIQGINPGPEMLTTHLDVTLFMVWVLVAANIIGSLLCLPFLRHLAKITFVRGEVLIPFVLVMVLVGAASSSGQPADIYVALLAGLLSWVMRIYGWPIVPLLLGVVLGSTAENALIISVNVYGWSWLTRPGVLAITALIALAIFAAYRTRRRGQRADAAAGNAAPAENRVATIVGAAGLTLLFAWIMFEAQGFPTGGREYPLLVGGVSLAAAVFLLVTSVIGRLRHQPAGDDAGGTAGNSAESATAPAGSDNLVHHGVQQTAVGVQERATAALTGTIEDEHDEDDVKRSALGAFAWFVGAALAVLAGGFLWGTFAFTAIYLAVVARMHVVRAALVGAVFGLLVHLIFTSVFGLLLPLPWLWLWTP